MTMPLLISVPHAGRLIPGFLKNRCLLSEAQISADGDEGSWEIYRALRGEVAAFYSTDIARAVVDLNRAPDDIRLDGVVKTHTCWDEPIWTRPLTATDINSLLEQHYFPYHGALSHADHAGAVLAVDCHTMAAIGPPIGPDTGQSRPQVCIGYGEGTCPLAWVAMLKLCFQAFFPGEVTLNQPFSGGYITRYHSREMPWVQLELSRDDYASVEQKAIWVRGALEAWCEWYEGQIHE